MNRIIKQVDFPAEAPKLTRVAAYARVSSGKDAMLHSLSAQVSYYSGLIQKHPDWQYCGVYADEALTGTKDNRENFQRMLDDCRAGKLDLIITKSISRFARNTVTLLETVRELKLLGVNICFEEQNIFTLSADGELMMTILASYAQEESRSASENQKWRIRANFQHGLPWNGTLLGYRIQDGVYIPVEKEAELVQLIFSLYNGGWGTYKIAKQLNNAGYRTRRGNQWTQSSLQKLLKNYAYTGNLLLQTTFTKDHISKKSCVNRGQLPMYHAEDSHEAIVPIREFEAAQSARQERAAVYVHASDPSVVYPFRGKLLCTGCGKHYRRKVVRRGPAWVCGTYNSRGKEFCPTSKLIPEDTLMAVTAEVLGTGTFEEAVFLEQVERIEVGTENHLTYIFKDGSSVFTVWQDRSRRESWTPDMREAARQTVLQQGLPGRDSDGRFKNKNGSCLPQSSDQGTAQHGQRRSQR